MSRIRRVGQLENAAQIETENWSTHRHTNANANARIGIPRELGTF